MNAPPSVPLFAADRPHSKCSRRFFHFQFLLIGKAFTEPRVQRVVLLIQKKSHQSVMRLFFILRQKAHLESVFSNQYLYFLEYVIIPFEAHMCLGLCSKDTKHLASGTHIQVNVAL